MAKVNAVIATQSSTVTAALAVVFAGLAVSLVASNGTVFATKTAAPGNYSVDFDNVPADTYTVTAQAVDSNGSAIGAQITSSPFSIADDPAPAPAPAAPQTQTLTFDQPISVSVTQS